MDLRRPRYSPSRFLIHSYYFIRLIATPSSTYELSADTAYMQTIACWSALPVSFTIGPKYVDFALVVSQTRLNDIGSYKTSRTVLIIQVDLKFISTTRNRKHHHSPSRCKTGSMRKTPNALNIREGWRE